MNKKIKIEFNEFVNAHIAKILVDMGYNQKKRYFYFLNGDMQYSYEIRIEEVAKKAISFSIIFAVNSITINKIIGVTLKRKPKGYDNLYFKNNVDLLGENSENEFQFALQEDNKILIAKIEKFLNIAEAKLEKIKSAKTLINLCIAENGLVHHKSIFKYLIATNNTKQLEEYLESINKKLHAIAEKAYSAYLNKVKELKNVPNV